MKIQLALLLAVPVLLGATCSGERTHSFKSKYPVSDAPYVAPQIEGRWVNCPGPDAETCGITITVKDACDANDIVLEDFVALGEAKKKIVWTLPAGYQFCPRAGDGVFLKDPTVPDDVFEPKPTPKCDQTFEWKRKKSDGKIYGYLLRFRSVGKICGVKDPWMQN